VLGFRTFGYFRGGEIINHMKRILLLIAILVITSVAGCEKDRQTQTDQLEIEKEELAKQVEQLRMENEKIKEKNEYLEFQNKELQPRIQQLISGYGPGIWGYEENNNFPVFVKSMPGVDVTTIINKLNERFKKDGQPLIKYKKKEQRTVFIGLDSEKQLGERMGSYGALSYMAAVSYSLTSVREIDCVYFDIREHEHAGPGKYCEGNLEFYIVSQ
jgi:outer membrane murein-binding lipoprotein Lpp